MVPVEVSCISKSLIGYEEIKLLPLQVRKLSIAILQDNEPVGDNSLVRTPEDRCSMLFPLLVSG